jgi:hypothetical protein
MSAAGTREALLRRSVTMTDLERAARRFVADVDSVLGRCDDSAQSIIAALALITVGKHMDRRVLERALGGAKDLGRIPSRRKTTRGSTAA